MALLERYGARVLLTRSPKNAQVVITSQEPATTLPWEIKTQDDKSVLVISGDGLKLAPFLDDLEGLTLGARSFDVKTGAPLNRIYREELGLSAEGLKTNAGIEWSTTLAAPMTQGLHPSSLSLSLSASFSPEVESAQLFVYLNEDLVRVARVKADEKPQRLHLPLLPKLTTFPARLRLELVAQAPSQRCRVDSESLRAQILPDSWLELSPHNPGGKDFVSFSQKAAAGYTLSVPSEVLAQPIPWLHQLSYLRRSFGLEADKGEVSSDGTLPVIKLMPAGAKSKLSHVYRSIKTLDLTSDQPLVVWESDKEAQAPTIILWSLSKPFRPEVPLLSADQNDLIVMSASRVELRARTKDLKGELIEFSGSSKVLEFLERWRYWLLGLSWILLTGLFVFIAKRLKQ